MISSWKCIQNTVYNQHIAINQSATTSTDFPKQAIIRNNIDPDLTRNARNYRDNHKYRDVKYITIYILSALLVVNVLLSPFGTCMIS